MSLRDRESWVVSRETQSYSKLKNVLSCTLWKISKVSVWNVQRSVIMFFSKQINLQSTKEKWQNESQVFGCCCRSSLKVFFRVVTVGPLWVLCCYSGWSNKTPPVTENNNTHKKTTIWDWHLKNQNEFHLFINDSISTNPDRAVACEAKFDDCLHLLLSVQCTDYGNLDGLTQLIN